MGEEEFKTDLTNLVDYEALGDAPEAVREAFRLFQEAGVKRFPIKTASCISEGAGFVLLRGLPHGKFAWSVRKHPRVHATYRALYPHAERLVTSQDITFFTPDGAPADRSAFAAHSDQNLHDVRPGLSDCEVYQGILYIWPSAMNGHSSTTVVWPGSHRNIWPELMKDSSFTDSGQAGFHYSEIRDMADETSKRKLADAWAKEARRVPVPAGALL